MLKLNHLTGFGSGAAAAAAGADVTSYVLDSSASSYLSVADHADWTLGAGNLTIDFWFRVSSFNGTGGLFDHTDDNVNNISIGVSATALRARLRIASSGAPDLNSGAITVNTSQWYHVAMIRGWSGNANDWALTLDGAPVDTETADVTIPNHSADLRIGYINSFSDDYFNGQIDEFRISDSARWTADFSASLPTTQHTSDANTLLLIHGGEAYTGALTGETTQSCVTFDGSGDYLSVADHADWDWGTPTSDWTIEAWVNPVTAGSQTIWYQGIEFGVHSSGVAVWYGIGGAPEATGTTSLTDGLWHHVAAVRSGTDVFLYTDGGDKQTVDVTGDDHNRTAGPFIGSTSTATDYNGQIAEVRVSNTARYTDATFTVPTERFTSDGNTKLLIHGDENGGGTAAFTDSGNTGHTVTPTGNAFLGNGGTFTDSGNTGHTVSENGQAQKETAQEFKFADDGVGYFLDGNDYLSVADSGDWDFSTGDFSIEGFFRWNDVTAQTDSLFTHEENDSDPYWVLQWASGTGKFTFISNFGGVSSIAFDTWTPTVNTWYHIGLARASGTLYLEVDGVAKGDGAFATDVTGIVAALEIGGGRFASDFQGHMDEVRISDTDRRSEWPPATQYASDANTLLLIHGGETKSGTTGSGATFTDSGNTGHTVTENGNAIESTGNFYKF